MALVLRWFPSCARKVVAGRSRFNHNRGVSVRSARARPFHRVKDLASSRTLPTVWAARLWRLNMMNMKNVIIGLILIVAAGLAYYQFSYVPAQKAEAAAEATKKAADEAAAKAAEETAAAAKAAEEAAAKVAADAAAGGTAAADGATTAATDAADAAAALDPATFDAAKVTALIDASALDDATKTSLKSAVTAADGNPALVPGAIDQVKAALGL